MVSELYQVVVRRSCRLYVDSVCRQSACSSCKVLYGYSFVSDRVRLHRAARLVSRSVGRLVSYILSKDGIRGHLVCQFRNPQAHELEGFIYKGSSSDGKGGLLWYYKPKTGTQLNGSHGEYTNSDDVNELDYANARVVVVRWHRDTFHFTPLTVHYADLWCTRCGSRECLSITWETNLLCCRSCDAYFGYWLNVPCQSEVIVYESETWENCVRFAEIVPVESWYEYSSVNGSYPNWTDNLQEFTEYAGDPVVDSQINGNNGEWTNGDDVEDMMRAAGELERQLARPGRRHDGRGRGGGGGRGNAGGARNNNNNNHHNAGARVNDRPQDIVAPPPPPFEEQRHHVANQLDEGYVYDGVFYSQPVYAILPPGRYDVGDNGLGWFSTASKPKHNFAMRSAWQEYIVPEYYTSGVKHGIKNFRLLTHIVRSVESKLRLTTLSSVNLTAAQNCISRSIQDLPQHLIQRHKDYFYYLSKFNERKHELLVAGITSMDRNPYAVLEVYDNDAEDSLELEQPFRIPSVDCQINFVYEQDDDIEVTGNFIEEVDRDGNTHHVLDTDELVGNTKWYRTAMFSLEGHRKFTQYDNSDRNANKALKRLLAKNDNHATRARWEERLAAMIPCHFPHFTQQMREACAIPETYRPLNDEEQHLFRRQQCALEKMSWYITERFDRTWIDFVRNTVPETASWAYNSMYLGFMEYVEPLYSRFANADIPHVKRKLRQAYVKFCGEYDTQLIMVTRLEAKVKNELAKTGKAPRLYVGYEAGCMYANELPEFIKMCMSNSASIYSNGHYYTIHTFTKPKIKEISDVFDKICRGLPPNEHIICIYSDDSVWSGNNGGELYAHNADIAACDASVKSAGFALSCAAMARFDEERSCGLVNQCKLPITMRSRADRGRKIKVQRYRTTRHVVNDEEVVERVIVPIEGSGTVMTTMNNFLVMLMCAFMYIESGQFGPHAIHEAGILCGLNLEVSENFAEIPEKLQFLKYSPILCSDGRYHLVRNYGCILRSLGKVEGDMSPLQLGLSLDQFNQTDWKTRTNIFVASVVASYIHEPASELMVALRSRFPGPAIAELPSIVETDATAYTVVEESMARRYDVAPEDLRLLANRLRDIRVGDIIVDEILTRIYNEDYAL